ncbi:MAG: dynamin family protein [Planctomycetota bacterium]|nr:dynamin family protein [Planctomycetota bacterium]
MAGSVQYQRKNDELPHFDSDSQRKAVMKDLRSWHDALKGALAVARQQAPDSRKGFHAEDIEVALEQVSRDLSQSSSDDSLTVTVVGPMSSGKSSLINALVGKKDFLPSSGTRTTACATEITQNKEGQYRARVEYAEDELLAKILRAYLDAVAPDKQGADRRVRALLKENGIEDWHNLTSEMLLSSIDKIRTAAWEKIGNASEKSSEYYLRRFLDALGKRSTLAPKRLTNWQSFPGTDAGFEQMTAMIKPHCALPDASRYTDPLQYENDVCRQVLLRSVHIEIPHTILGTNIRLVDLPGLGSQDARDEEIARCFYPDADGVIYLIFFPTPDASSAAKIIEQIREVRKQTQHNVIRVTTVVDSYGTLDWTKKNGEEGRKQLDSCWELSKRFGLRSDFDHNSYIEPLYHATSAYIWEAANSQQYDAVEEKKRALGAFRRQADAYNAPHAGGILDELIASPDGHISELRHFLKDYCASYLPLAKAYEVYARLADTDQDIRGVIEPLCSLQGGGSEDEKHLNAALKYHENYSRDFYNCVRGLLKERRKDIRECYFDEEFSTVCGRVRERLERMKAEIDFEPPEHEKDQWQTLKDEYYRRVTGRNIQEDDVRFTSEMRGLLPFLKAQVTDALIGHLGDRISRVVPLWKGSDDFGQDRQDLKAYFAALRAHGGERYTEMLDQTVLEVIKVDLRQKISEAHDKWTHHFENELPLPFDAARGFDHESNELGEYFNEILYSSDLLYDACQRLLEGLQIEFNRVMKTWEGRLAKRCVVFLRSPEILDIIRKNPAAFLPENADIYLQEAVIKAGQDLAEAKVTEERLRPAFKDLMATNDEV